MARLAALACALVLIPAAFALARPADNVKPNRTYEGETTQGAVCGTSADQPCAIALSTNGKGRKQDLEISFSAPCDSGRTLRSTIGVESLPIAGNGEYRYRFDLTIELTGMSPGTATGVMLLDGEFKRGRTAGFSKRTDVTIEFNDGTETDCSAPRFEFSAKP